MSNTGNNMITIPKTNAKIDGKKSSLLAPTASKPPSQSFRAFFLDKNKNTNKKANNDVIRSVMNSNTGKKNQRKKASVLSRVVE